MLRSEPLAISAMTVLELAMLASEGRVNLNRPLDQFLGDLASNVGVRLLPITFEIALEAATLRSLRDPADRAIVGTARVHRLRLVTSDQRIIDSNLVPVIE
jgi:PIN domain nuclease of toxin-antitoxin system